ncbi:mechanosensitive ion channel family protein [Fulvivirga lutea]|uniref:Mechanosensitive ion channel n=1 Tax=Fulvivirga lutea TaxID=2810512 RepID=A0A975A1L7_9BACT|nr:mechanosensitive ion channel domain-containing protein [Fulvivirga lutea]QSE97961.1 mechanosensitive ion channel [Fulvivirga lutea]
MSWNELIQLSYFRVALVSIIAFIGAIIIRWAFFKIINRYAENDDLLFIQALKNRLNNSIFLFIPFVAMRIILDVEYPDQLGWLKSCVEILVVVSITILIIKLIYVIQDVLFEQFDMNKDDNIKERKALTQIIFIRKLVIVVVALIAMAIVLLSFDSVRKYGATILTSAGVAGIIVGFAAQKTLSNLLAGIQIAFTQPIRIDDAVVVEDEWGWIEEINLTYVVVRIWDLRRLVLPITYFTETPFQNWTKSSSQILGATILYLDYTTPIDKLREEFDKILERSEHWDKDKKSLQVTDASEKTIKVRMLMTARNSPEAWDLRCFVREEMVKYIQKNHPESLPTFRANINEKS